MKLTKTLTTLAIALTMVSMVSAAPKARPLKFDIAENGTRFSSDTEPVDEDGIPLYGAEFLTEGYLYPHGFLEDHEGVNEDGSPTHPDQVQGQWTCRGWHVGEGGNTETGPWVVTHQLFDLKETFGAETLTTDGYELVDVGVPCERAITGGTGKYSVSRGDSTQILLGFNESLGVNARVVLRPVNPPKPQPRPKFKPWWAWWN